MNENVKRVKANKLYLQYHNYDIPISICKDLIEDYFKKYELVEDDLGLVLDSQMTLHVYIKTSKRVDIRSYSQLTIQYGSSSYTPEINSISVPEEILIDMLRLNSSNKILGNSLKGYKISVDEIFKYRENTIKFSEENCSGEIIDTNLLQFCSTLSVNYLKDDFEHNYTRPNQLNNFLLFIEKHLKLNLTDQFSLDKSELKVSDLLMFNQLKKLRFMQNIVNSKESLYNKQEKIERADYLLLNNALRLQYNVVSSRCKKFIFVLEMLFDSYDIENYTLASVSKRCLYVKKKIDNDGTISEEQEEKIKELTSMKLKGHKFIAIVKFLLIKEMLKHEKDSISLVLLHCLYLLIFNYLNNSLPSKREEGLVIPKDQKIEAYLAQKIDNLRFKRTMVAEEYIEEVFSQLDPYLKLKFKSLQQKEEKVSEKLQSCLQNIKSMTSDLSEENIQEIDKLAKKLKKGNLSIEFSDEEKTYLSDIFLYTFESFKFITTELVHLDEEYPTFSVQWNTEFVTDLFAFQTSVSNFPMIIEPKDWKPTNIDENSYNQKSLNLGGMLLNETNIFPGINLRTKKSSSTIKEPTLETINYLQKVPFKVNTEFLKEIETYFLFYLACYLNTEEESDLKITDFMVFEKYNKDTDTWENISPKLNELKDPSIKGKLRILESFRIEYLKRKRPDLVDFYLHYKKTEEILPELDSSFQEVSKMMQKVTREYNKLNQKVYTFFDIFFTSQIMKHFEKFYFVCLFDFRLRLYYIGSLFIPQGVSLVKSLLEFAEPRKTISKSDHYNAYGNQVVDSWKKDARKDSSKSFFLHKYCTGIASTVVGMDVSASGFQIYAFLAGNEQVLEQTNFWMKKGIIPMSKLDLYKDFMDNFIPELEVLVDEKNKKPKFLNKSLISYSYISLSYIKFIFKKIITLFKDRSFAKNILMCYLYSEGHYSRVIKLLDKLENDSAVILKQDQIKNKYNSKESKLPTLFTICYEASMQFVETFKKLYPDIFELKQYLEERLAKHPSVVKAQGIYLQAPGLSSVFYSLERQETKRYKTLTKDGSIIRYTKQCSVDEFDTARASHSIGPNFIHYLDGNLLVKVIEKCKENNIPVYTAHDCFYTTVDNSEKLKTYYYEAACEIFIHAETNQYVNFIQANIDESFLDKEELELINESQQRLLKLKKLVEKKQYLMSPFILTP